MRHITLAKDKDFRLHFQSELDSFLPFCQDGAAQGISELFFCLEEQMLFDSTLSIADGSSACHFIQELLPKKIEDDEDDDEDDFDDEDDEDEDFDDEDDDFDDDEDDFDDEDDDYDDEDDFDDEDDDYEDEDDDFDDEDDDDYDDDDDFDDEDDDA